MDADEYMRERAGAFDELLQGWMAERVKPIGEKVDPSDRDYVIKNRAKELASLAEEKALKGALTERARPYGGVLGFVKSLYDRIDPV